MRYIVSVHHDGYGNQPDLKSVLTELENTEVSLLLNGITALVKTDKSPDELQVHLRKSFQEGVIAIFLMRHPFALDSAYNRVEVIPIREALYREEIEELHEKLKARGI